MMISKKGRYTLRVMVDLAENSDGGYVMLKDIAERQELPEAYIIRIMEFLSEHGMVDIMHEEQKYHLSMSPDKYSVGSILRLVEGTLAPVDCLDCKSGKCERSEKCSTLPMWKEVDRLINGYFDNLSLEMIMNMPKEER